MNKKKKAIVVIVTTLLIGVTLGILLTAAPMAATNPGSMQAFWRMDTGSGSVAVDSSDSVNDGMLSGGMFGNALEFDGVDDYVNIPDSTSLDITDEITVEAWVNLDASHMPHSYFVGKDTTGQRSYGIGIDGGHYPGKNFYPFFVAFHSAGHTSVWGNSPLTIDQWYHIAGTYDSDTGIANIFINGELSGTASATPGTTIFAGTADLQIGARQYPGYWRSFTDGTIDEVRISNIIRYSGNFVPQTTEFATDANTAALFHLDESVGTTVYDETMNGYNGESIGATWSGPTWTIGKYGNALEFDGVDDYVTVPANSITGNPMTITWWMKTDDMAAVVFMDKVGWQGTEGMEIWLYTNTGGYGYLNVRGSSGANVASSSDYHGEWVHVAVVFDGTTAKIYRNGVFDTGGTIGEVTTSTHDLIMGMYDGLPSWHFNGIIDEVQIWGMALTPCQVQLAMEGKIEILPDAGMVIYKSAFHNIEEGEVITIGIVTSDPSITISHLEPHHTTPKKKSSFPTVVVLVQCDEQIVIKITDISEQTMTAHYWIMLSNGEYVGLNLHFNH
jgi:hypothetical protein